MGERKDLIELKRLESSLSNQLQNVRKKIKNCLEVILSDMQGDFERLSHDIVIQKEMKSTRKTPSYKSLKLCQSSCCQSIAQQISVSEQTVQDILTLYNEHHRSMLQDAGLNTQSPTIKVVFSRPSK